MVNLREVAEYFDKEGAVIAKAPVTFAIALILLGAVIAWVLNVHYTALLTLKDEQLKGKDDQLRGKDDQLKGKDDLISEYREKLHELPPAQSVYTRLSNADLQKKTLTLVQQLRQFIEKSRYPIFPPTYPPTASEEEKNKIWQQETARLLQVSQNVITAYNKQFKSDVLLLYDELRSRLAQKENDKDQSFLYEYANSPNVMEMAANDLERLAKSLPITGGSN